MSNCYEHPCKASILLLISGIETRKRFIVEKISLDPSISKVHISTRLSSLEDEIQDLRSLLKYFD